MMDRSDTGRQAAGTTFRQSPQSALPVIFAIRLVRGAAIRYHLSGPALN
jgi:hypothetical protein